MKKKWQRQTRRLEVRPLQLKDFEKWQQAYSCMRPPQNEWDESNWQSKFLTLAAFKKTLQRQKLLRQQDKNYAFGVFRKDDGEYIGLIRVNEVSRGIVQNAYLGYRIFNPYWGYGYAKESIKAVVEIAFQDLNLHRLEACIEPKNKASLAVIERLKFHCEGLSRKRLFFREKWIDLRVYAITSEDLRIKYRFKPSAAEKRKR